MSQMTSFDLFQNHEILRVIRSTRNVRDNLSVKYSSNLTFHIMKKYASYELYMKFQVKKKSYEITSGTITYMYVD